MASAFSGQFGFSFGIVLSVAQFDIQRVALEFPAHFDAERAGFKLIYRHAGGSGIDLLLRSAISNNAFGGGDCVEK